MLEIPDTQEIVLLLDIDGTLLDIAATPDLVYVSKGLVDCIVKLRTRMMNAVAFVSGRMMDDVDRLFAPLKMAGAYSHGGEIRFPNREVVRDLVSTNNFVVACDLAQVWRQLHPEIIVEYKGDALALHYRQAKALAGEVREFAERLQILLGDNYHLLEGKSVIEIKPVRRSKGYAIRELMKSPQWRGRMPVFMGDDITDEDGFEAVNEAGGLSIKVGQGETLATLSLPDPHAVRQWIQMLAA